MNVAMILTQFHHTKEANDTC